MKKINILAFNLFSLINVPVSIYDKTNKIMDYNNHNIPFQLEKIIEENKSLICKERLSIETSDIIKLTDPSYFTYIGININKYELVIGPFLEYEFDTLRLSSLKMRLKVIGEDDHVFDDFYNKLVVLTPLNIEFIVNSFIYSSEKKAIEINYKNIEGKVIKIKHQEKIDSLFKHLEYVKQNYETEALFVNVVESGNVKNAKAFVTEKIMTHLPARAINDTLRNEKTRLTILNTLCNRAAIRGGIDNQLGHQISTNYGIRIERAKSIYTVNQLSREIIIGYTEAVSNYSLKMYSKLIRNAILFIRRNITERYTLSDLAKDLFVSKEHLSRTFKKETKMTVSQYIHYSKILEAKKLLLKGEQSILNISSMLGYSSSSQFSSVFKKQMGISPKEYKKRVINSN